MRHKLPACAGDAGEGAQLPTPEAEAWQATHAPMLALRVWVGETGETWVNVNWAEDVRAETTTVGDVMDTLRVLLAVNDTVMKLMRAIEATVSENARLAAMGES